MAVDNAAVRGLQQQWLKINENITRMEAQLPVAKQNLADVAAAITQLGGTIPTPTDKPGGGGGSSHGRPLPPTPATPAVKK